MHPDLVPPDSLDGHSEKEIFEWKTEYDVVSTLRAAGHDVKPLGVQDELKPIRYQIENWKPHVVFNLLEQFHGETAYDQNVASFLELMRVPYTGCNPRGLMLARGKALAKKLLHYHRIPTPAFAVFPKGRKIRRPARLGFPLIVKSISEDASRGIAQASLVDSDEKLAERVTFVHEKIATDAIAEQYIEGRELYVGVLGNDKPEALPVVELDLSKLPEGTPKIAGSEVKWEEETEAYKRTKPFFPDDLEEGVITKLHETAVQAFTALQLRDYGRIDFRLAKDGTVHVLEVNPNPYLHPTAEFSMAAKKSGRSYIETIREIADLAMARYAAES
jgi:D-alanine-D-alanine ligase